MNTRRAFGSWLFSVGGSFSARVPRSSAEVRREFVHHIVEVEVDGQKEGGQGDQRDDEEGEAEATLNDMTHGMSGDLEPCRP